MNLTEVASVLVANAELGPDPRMKGTTDCYLVTLDDMEALRQALAAAADYYDPFEHGAPTQAPRHLAIERWLLDGDTLEQRLEAMDSASDQTRP